MFLAGTPPAIVCAGTSSATTGLEAIAHPGLMVTPARTTKVAPTKVPSPTMISGNDLAFARLLGQATSWESVMNRREAPLCNSFRT